MLEGTGTQDQVLPEQREPGEDVPAADPVVDVVSVPGLLQAVEGQLCLVIPVSRDDAVDVINWAYEHRTDATTLVYGAIMSAVFS